MADTILNETKTDAIGEIHNITMGSAADAVSAMIDA
ncbi:MAG: chemotaxis protein CheC, partial [Oscillospiraceae bacterium]|nr:chemotaxis protein CheC [Oscillospiraceae bacterium]